MARRAAEAPNDLARMLATSSSCWSPRRPPIPGSAMTGCRPKGLPEEAPDRWPKLVRRHQACRWAEIEELPSQGGRWRRRVRLAFALPV